MSTRVRSSDHFRDRSTASSSSSSSRCLQSYFLPFFFFEQERRLGKISHERCLVILFRMWFLWKLETTSQVVSQVFDASRFRFLFFFYFLIPSLRNSSIHRREEEKNNRILFFSSRRKNYFPFQRLICC